MAIFTAYFNDAEEKILSDIMKKASISTKNKGLIYSITHLASLRKEVEKLQRERQELYVKLDKAREDLRIIVEGHRILNELSFPEQKGIKGNKNTGGLSNTLPEDEDED